MTWKVIPPRREVLYREFRLCKGREEGGRTTGDAGEDCQEGAPQPAWFDFFDSEGQAYLRRLSRCATHRRWEVQVEPRKARTCLFAQLFTH